MTYRGNEASWRNGFWAFGKRRQRQRALIGAAVRPIVEMLETRQYLALIVDSFPNVVVDPGTPTRLDVAFHAEGSTWYSDAGAYATAYDQDVTYNVTFDWNPHDPSDTLAGDPSPETVMVTVPAGHALGHASVIHSYSDSGSHPVSVAIDGPYGAGEEVEPTSGSGAHRCWSPASLSTACALALPKAAECWATARSTCRSTPTTLPPRPQVA